MDTNLLNQSLNKNQSETLSKEFLRKILDRKNVCELIIQQVNTKKNILKLCKLLNTLELSDCFDYMMTYFVDNISKKEKEYPFFSYYYNIDYISLYTNFIELSKKNPEFNLIKTIDKEHIKQLFKDIKIKHTQQYIKVVQSGYIDPIENYSKKLTNGYIEPSKSSLNTLITLFEFDNKIEILNKILNILKVVYIINPLLTDIKKELLLDTLNKIDTVSNNSFLSTINEIQNLFNEKDTLFEHLDNTFSIILNLEGITLAKLKMNHPKEQDGKFFVQDINTILEQSKINKIPYFEDFKDNSKLIHNMYTYSKSGNYFNNDMKIQIHKRLEFYYNNEEDKKTKHQLVTQFLNIALKLTFPENSLYITRSNEYFQIINTLLIQHSLDKSITNKIIEEKNNEQSTNLPKAKKIKI